MFIISHYEKESFLIMKQLFKSVYKTNSASESRKDIVDFGAYSEQDTSITRKCYRCKQVKDIDCFQRCYCTSKHSYDHVKYTLTCSACLDTGQGIQSNKWHLYNNMAYGR